MRIRLLAVPTAILFLCGAVALTMTAALSETTGVGDFSLPDPTKFEVGTRPLEEGSRHVGAEDSGVSTGNAEPSNALSALEALDISHLIDRAGSDDACFPYQVPSVYVPETGHHVHLPFLPYWEELDLVVLGLPISEPTTAQSITVQYFEQGRLEYHPATEGGPARMLLSPLGSWQSQGLTGRAFESKEPGSYGVGAEVRYFEETGHYLLPPFTTFWREYGGRSVFGPPISDQYQEGELVVQYFVGVRLEWSESTDEVRVSPLGRELAAVDGVDITPVARRVGVPDFGDEPVPGPVRIPTLMYHQFGVPESRYQVSHWKFEQQLIWLRDNGYTTVTVDRAFAAVFRGAPLPEKPVLITFDDGWAGQWEAAAILEKYGMRGVFFVLPGKIELTFDELRDLQRRGHELGSHSVSHADLVDLSDDELWSEIAGSKAQLEDILGRDVDYFAYPYGSYDERVSGVVAAAGYCGAVRATHPDGASWLPEARWDQPRIDVPGEIELETFIRLVESS